MSSVSDYTSYSNAMQRTQDSYEAERSQSRAQHEREIDQLKEGYQAEKEKSRKESNEEIQKIRDEAAEDVRKLKEEMYNKSGKKFTQDSQDLAEERNKLHRYREEIQKDAEHRMEKLEHSAREKGLKSMQTEDRKVEEALAAAKRSHLDEINQLKDEMEIYKTHRHDLEREKANARQEQVVSYEAEHLSERDRLIAAYEQRINKLKDKQVEREHLFSRQLNDATFDANERSKQQVQTQKEEFNRIDQDRRAEARRLEAHYENEVKNEQLRNSRSESTLIRRNDEDLNRALSQKDRNYQDHLKETGNRHREELHARDEEIATLKTTSDPQKVSPFVVQKIQTEAEKRYYASLKQEQEVSQKNIEALKQRDHNERQEMKDDFTKKHVDWSREQQRMNDASTRQFVMGYEDLKNTRQIERDQMKTQHSDQLQRITSQHAQAMDLQQRKHRNDLEVQRDTLTTNQEQRQEDLEFKQRSQDREWLTRMNEMRRGYERKMNDDRDQADRLLNEIKFSFDKKLQDQERISKRALDDRVRAYEHQIAQQNEAFQERTRFLTEHYEEELDRMRHTNARLIQKKS